jgi:hypothetical protein
MATPALSANPARLHPVGNGQTVTKKGYRPGKAVCNIEENPGE